MELTDSSRLLKIDGSVVYEPDLTNQVRAGILQPLPSIILSNQVEWVNGGFKDALSLGFKKGEHSPLAVGLVEKSAVKTSSLDRIVYCRLGHYRSAIISGNLDATYFQGTGFRYLDSKGVGNITDEDREVSYDDPRYSKYLRVIPVKPDLFLPGKTWGLADKQLAVNDIRGMRKLEKLQVRTIPIVAVTQLQEVVETGGKKISLDEAIRRGLLNPSVIPMEIFRAWVTPFRLQDVFYTPYEDKKFGIVFTEKDVERKRNIVRQAFGDMQNDLSIPYEVRQGFGNLDIKKYLDWLGFVIGDGLGRMHSAKLTHGFLRALHNITLDGRIVDLDSNEGDPRERPELDLLTKDYKAIFDTTEPFYADFLPGMGKLFNVSVNPDKVLKIATDAYNSHF